ncbi:phytanoyl-CoA dioxygenase family protein [Nocardia gipuzkoensis]|uniref:phytanoyl-CoA dioxygenase family protein n=1 Tax=Nocardia gipuzkoensis TaxID=2749991 RepID=UPI00237DCCCE|nr:phytanoyl-CoA dioxygenase family protein [Nocardia gipuzkoensis]MDE1674753.1 phytanoyl-CoA dioxygenase family protein [Nocardia gipuzkoensis]
MRDEHPPVQPYPRVSDGVTRLRAEIDAAGLGRHVVDLEVNGFTVLEEALTDEHRAELTAQLLRWAGTDEDREVDVASGHTHRDRTQEVPLLLTRGGAAFRQLVLDRRTLRLMTYLLGAHRQISSVTGYVKGPGRCDLRVHSDTAYVPDPLPPYAQVANINYCLTDYTLTGGCLSMVPGSHRYCQRPRGGHGEDELVAVQAPAGSAIVFHGNTWHGAFPRSEPGVRLTISTLFARSYMRPQENYAALYSDGDLTGLPAEFAQLVGLEPATGWASPAEAAAIVARRRDRGRDYYRTRSQHG